jgi:hypothetical protein
LARSLSWIFRGSLSWKIFHGITDEEDSTVAGLAAIIAGIAGAAIDAAAWMSAAFGAAQQLQAVSALTLDMPRDIAELNTAITPDGRTVVVSVQPMEGIGGQEAASRLYLRPL